MTTYPVVTVRQQGRRPLYVEVRDTLEVGRECDGLLIDDLQCSRRHVSLVPSNGAVIVRDLGSTNGTFVNETLMTSSVELAPGVSIRLGSTTIELATAGDESPAGSVKPAAPAFARATSIEMVARSVEREQDRETGSPSIGRHEGTVTIVFSDIESSTELATRLGDTAWIAVLNAHNAVIRRSLQKWGGTEVKNQGDGFMLTFPSARRALCCMAEVQQGLAHHAEENPEQAVRIRVGVHTGEVIVDENDIFGKHVIIAARIANLAVGGEILVSSLVWDIVSARGDLVFDEPRSVALKGIEGSWTVFPMQWVGFTPTA